MEESQKKHITSNKSSLLNLIFCNEQFLACLEEKSVIKSFESNKISKLSTETDKCKELLEILKTRKSGYDALEFALIKTNQTGALDIVQKLSGTGKLSKHSNAIQSQGYKPKRKSKQLDGDVNTIVTGRQKRLTSYSSTNDGTLRNDRALKRLNSTNQYSIENNAAEERSNKNAFLNILQSFLTLRDSLPVEQNPDIYEQFKDIISKMQSSSTDFTPQEATMVCHEFDHFFVKCLISMGGIEVQNSRKNSVMHLLPAVFNSHQYHDYVVGIAESKNSVFGLVNNEGKTPLHTAVEHFEVESKTLEILKDINGLFTTRDNNGRCLLLASAAARRYVFIQLLGTYGCKRDLTDNDKKSMAHIAAQYGNEDALSQTVKRAGVKINEPDVMGRTPLHCVFDGCFKNWLKCVNILMKAVEVDVNAKVTGCDDKTALHLLLANQEISSMDQIFIYNLLTEKGAKVNQPDAHGSSAVHTACKFAHEETILHIICNGSIKEEPNLELKNCNNEDPSSILKKRGINVLVAVVSRLKHAGLAVDSERRIILSEPEIQTSLRMEVNMENGSVMEKVDDGTAENNFAEELKIEPNKEAMAELLRHSAQIKKLEQRVMLLEAKMSSSDIWNKL